ncbi:MAG: ABC transporter ATP-binding protein [Candidatus Norongarragalinales archaeon]
MALLEVHGVSKSFREDSRSFKVLDDITFSVEEQEFICIIGPSGCGKTLLLNIVAGLVKPDKGKILFEQQPITAENPKVANVFQSFALFPWLTAAQNVELALEALGLPPAERKRRVKKYLSRVGIAGSGNAFPRELSAGMKQRVGIARALATEPVLLCMDEPFSALDPLTAENLREEVLLLWQSKEEYPDAVLMATNNVEEAVYLADRVIVLSHRPARIKAILSIRLSRPRNRKSPEFYRWVDKIYAVMT